MFNKKLAIAAAALCLTTALCGCNFNKTANKDDTETPTAAKATENTEKDIDTLPNTIDTYAKNYTEMGEVLPSKSLIIGDESQTEVKAEQSAKEGMATYNSPFGYALDYPEYYAPKCNFDGKEFIIIDEKSGSNLNVIITYPNILYESEETYSAALEGNNEIRLTDFEVTEINGINAVNIELAIQGGYAYQTVYRTGEYYYILSYVQGRGVTVDFDKDMKEVLSSLRLI